MARSVYRTAAPSPHRLVTPHAGAGDDPAARHDARSPLDALKKAAKIVDGTVNDAYLAAITGGLRRYHERHDVARQLPAGP